MAAKSNAGHVRKRQYQPSITSYLNRDAPASGLEKKSIPLSPQLPAETQASLLSVGMRVRKSVPEGYKTHKTIDTYACPYPSTAPPPSAPPVVSKVSYSIGDARELQPFCGLHKTGGWATQELPPSSAPAAMQADDDSEDDAPHLTTSQSTIPSTQGSFTSSTTAISSASRKRAYEDEIEDDLDAYFDAQDFDDFESSTHTTMLPVRPIARLKWTAERASGAETVRVTRDDDFNDAAFLVQPESMDMD